MVSDELWARIEPLLPVVVPMSGGPSRSGLRKRSNNKLHRTGSALTVPSA
jgi:transposase